MQLITNRLSNRHSASQKPGCVYVCAFVHACDWLTVRHTVDALTDGNPISFVSFQIEHCAFIIHISCLNKILPSSSLYSALPWFYHHWKSSRPYLNCIWPIHCTELCSFLSLYHNITHKHLRFKDPFPDTGTVRIGRECFREGPSIELLWCLANSHPQVPFLSAVTADWFSNFSKFYSAPTSM